MHTGDCHMAGKRHRPVDRDEARRLLATRQRVRPLPARQPARHHRLIQQASLYCRSALIETLTLLGQ
ncbi:DUF6233 domain-containing protein [Streptomyces albogriseolus]|uniref:DUF6233 domain-containing protein n=1 Tax=Streptomyces albogriseolus TaxID=1887 RepID=UPI00224CEADE|nr:DUF6233 domain-containing protein [Streptomyces viridodiastaticus]MCX4625125.1 DUF6233 domain-containing protein [Streptomyces viridodiastaticus]